MVSENLEHLWISTVWLGMDHGDGFDDQPLIFETGVFDQSEAGGGLGPMIDSDRYATEEEALRGHRAFVERYTNLIALDRLAGWSPPERETDQ